MSSISKIKRSLALKGIVAASYAQHESIEDLHIAASGISMNMRAGLHALNQANMLLTPDVKAQVEVVQDAADELYSVVKRTSRLKVDERFESIVLKYLHRIMTAINQIDDQFPKQRLNSAVLLVKRCREIISALVKSNASHSIRQSGQRILEYQL